MIAKFSQIVRSATDTLKHHHFYKPALGFAQSALATSVAVAALLIGFRQLGLLQGLELAAFDQMVRLRPDEGPDQRLLIVGITEGDIQKLNEWPISDRKVTEVLQKLEQLEPNTIGLDLLRDVPLGEGRAELTAFLQRSQRVVGVCVLSNGTSENPGTPPPPGLKTNQIGFSDLVVDSGGILRRTAFFIKPPETPGAPKHLCNDASIPFLSSFGFLIANRYLEQQGIKTGTSPKGELMVGSTVFRALEKNSGAYVNAEVGGYQMPINYRSPRTPAPRITLSDILAGNLDPKLVKGRIVLIGYTTDTVKDSFYTPYSAGKQNEQAMPGVVVHAQIISQILSAVLDHRPLFWFWPQWSEGLWIWVWALAGSTLAWRIPQPVRFGVLGSGVLVLCFGASFGLFWLGGWVPVAAPVLAFTMAATGVVLVDRFNKGGYAKVIGERVKQVLKIEIDHNKKEKQVAEITDSEFFRDLVHKKDQLRINKREIPHKIVSGPRSEDPPASSEPVSEVPPREPEEDYLTQLQQKARQHKQRTVEPTADKKGPAPVETSSTAPATSEDGFSDLQAKAKQMRQRRATDKNKDGNLEK